MLSGDPHAVKLMYVKQGVNKRVSPLYIEASAAAAAPVAAAAVAEGPKRVVVTPFAKKLAKQHKVGVNKVVGTGSFGRITTADVEAAAGITPAKSAVVSAPVATPTVAAAPAPAKSAPTYAEIPGATIVPFTTMQAAVSKNMIESLCVPTFRVGYPIIKDAVDALYAKIANGDEQVKTDAVRVAHYTDGQFPTDSKEFAKRIFYTVYMGMENSSDATRSRAKLVADEIGSWHLDVSIDTAVSVFLSLFQTLTGKRPPYKVDGGSNIENLGLQNLQARIRMVLAFMLASLLPWVHSKPGFYLVLGSSNVDEGLRSYLRKAARILANFLVIGSGI